MNKTPPNGFVVIASGEDGIAVQHIERGIMVIASWGGGWEHVSVSNSV